MHISKKMPINDFIKIAYIMHISKKMPIKNFGKNNKY